MAVIRTTYKAGAMTISAVVRFVDAGSAAILELERIVELLPAVPRRVEQDAEDVYAALMQMAIDVESPWDEFQKDFARIHQHDG